MSSIKPSPQKQEQAQEQKQETEVGFSDGRCFCGPGLELNTLACITKYFSINYAKSLCFPFLCFICVGVCPFTQLLA